MSKNSREQSSLIDELNKKKNIEFNIRIKAFIIIALAFVILLLVFTVITYLFRKKASKNISLETIDIPEYSGDIYYEINGNHPTFEIGSIDVNDEFEIYSELDDLGRCGVAYANLCKNLMPTEERGEIGNIKPSGWHTIKYPDKIEDLYLYNRCHLIAYSLSGENDNEKNLITGTRYFNVSGMLPFENKVRNYIEETENHVLYRVTPVFKDDNLLASGVQIEAYSIEDNGKGICFNVFIYNVQPGIIIDYSDGSSSEIK